ncbi:MAG: response regulator [Saprospiraceae bacterium]|nr:response regulator [Saprospiraceae bacterium]
MKLTYKILWLDDKIEELFIEDEYHKELERHLSDQGFKPEIVTVSTEDEFFKYLDSSFDLIMTDYHLKEKEGQTRDGDMIVQAIRDKSIFTEILFYSARGEVRDTYKLDRITFVETNRMTASHQEALMQSAIKLIDLTIKKFQHIVVMRGMIMHETSTLDEITLDILDTYLRKTRDSEIIELIFNSIISFYSEKHEKAEKYKSNSRLDKVIGDPLMLSASQRASALGAIIDKNGFENFISEFKAEIINIRNQFAHAVLDTDENGREFFRNKAEGITFNDALCKKIRSDINKHKINLDELIKKLKD